MTWAVFTIAGTAAVVCALGVVMSTNTVHSALMLVGTLFSVAVLFVLQDAHFLAAVQVLVYAGAIVVLFLFVIMLLGVDRAEVLEEPLRFQRWLAGGLFLAALAGFAFVATADVATGEASARRAVIETEEGNVQTIAETLFTDFIWPFEITSVLLVIAVVGAIVLVRDRRASDGTAAAGTSGDGTAADGEAVGATGGEEAS
jgi:NADH-quinone oxidoreductase subunit J